MWEQKRRELPMIHGLTLAEKEEHTRKLLFIEAEIKKLKILAGKLRTGTPAQRLAGFATQG